MNGHPAAGLMVRESTRRHLTEPTAAPRPHRPRRATARVLQAVAHRLDPYVATAPRASLGR